MIGSISLIRIQCGNNFYFVSLDEDKRIQSKKHTNSVQQRVQQSKTSTTAYFTKRGVYAHKTRIAQSLFLKKYVRNQESERLCICVLGYRFLPLFDLFYCRNIVHVYCFSFYLYKLLWHLHHLLFCIQDLCGRFNNK